MDCFDRPVKTSCSFVNMARKALARSAGDCWPYRKGMFFTTDWGLWVLKFSPIFGVLSMISATDMLESHSRALKMRILA